MKKNLFAMPHYDADTTATAAATAAPTDTGNIVDGVDLTKLTADDLAKLTDEEFAEFYKTVRAYVKAKSAAEWSELKSKVSTYGDTANRIALWVAVAAIGAKVFGLI